MEQSVWSDPRVLDMLKNDYVVVALYVDDKTTLPESEWYVSDYDGKKKKTLARKMLTFRSRNSILMHSPTTFCWIAAAATIMI